MSSTNNNRVKPVVILLLLLFTTVAAADHSNVTREEAETGIQDAEKDMREMQSAGFQVDAVNDTIQQARQALQRADFAHLLRRENASDPLMEKARNALEGLDTEQFTYRNVLTYTRQVAERRDTAFQIHDRLRATELKLQDYREEGFDTGNAAALVEEAETAFENEQYGTAQEKLQEANTVLEENRAEQDLGSALTNAGQNLLIANWEVIAVLAVFLFLGGVFDYVVLRKKRRENKIEQLKREKESVNRLMKQAQKNFFVNDDIPETVYNIRMEAYRDRLHRIEEKLGELRQEDETGNTEETWETVNVRIGNA